MNYVNRYGSLMMAANPVTAPFAAAGKAASVGSYIFWACTTLMAIILIGVGAGYGVETKKEKPDDTKLKNLKNSTIAFGVLTGVCCCMAIIAGWGSAQMKPSALMGHLM